MIAQSRDYGTVVIGLPLTDVDTFLIELIGLEIILSLLAIAGAWLAARAVVARSLRPLNRLAATAQQVSQLPLDRGEVALAVRVPPQDADPSSEVGQVGQALNHMLNNVEEALAARQASETKVRQFVADASHELRNPLAAIRGYAELTRRSREDLPADAAYALSRVEAESERMSHLVEDLLLLARLDSGPDLEIKAVDLTEIMINAVSDARAAGPDHTWGLALPDEPVSALGDRHRLHQVVANLLANARTHTPPGTRVDASLTVGEGQAVMTISDNGPGIPDGIRDQIFERFTRADTSRVRASGAANGASTGLGLAIVAAVVEARSWPSQCDQSTRRDPIHRGAAPGAGADPPRPRPRHAPASFTSGLGFGRGLGSPGQHSPDFDPGAASLAPGVSRSNHRSGITAGRDGGVQLVGVGDGGNKASPLKSRGGGRRLPPAGLNEEMTARGQPAGSLGDHPALDVETVQAAIESHHRLVQPRFRRHECDVLRRYVRGVAHHQIDSTGDLGWQCLEEVTAVNRGSVTDVPAGAAYGDRVDISRVQLYISLSYKQCGTDRSRAAAQVHHHGSRPREGGGLLNQELRSPARHEHTGLNHDLQSAELGPAKNMFQRFTRNPPVHHGLQLGRRGVRSEQQPGLVLREDAARLPQPPRHPSEFSRGLRSRRVRDIPTLDSVASLMARLAHSWQRRGMTSTHPSTEPAARNPAARNPAAPRCSTSTTSSRRRAPRATQELKI